MAKGERLLVAAVMTYISGAVAFAPPGLLWRSGRQARALPARLAAGPADGRCPAAPPLAAGRRAPAAAPHGRFAAARLSMLIENSLIERVDSRSAQSAIGGEDNQPVIIAFCAKRCGPCKVLEPQVLGAGSVHVLLGERWGPPGLVPQAAAPFCAPRFEVCSR
jgi:hypothetical protein